MENTFLLQRQFKKIFLLPPNFMIILPFGIVGSIRARSFKGKAGWQPWMQLLREGTCRRET